MNDKNKVLAISMAIIVFFLVLFGVGARAEEDDSILVKVQTLLVDNGIRVTIVYDVETNVMYMISRGGGVCMLVDAEGNPRLYTGAN